MHLYHNEKQLRDALEGCFGNCGNCVKGRVLSSADPFRNFRAYTTLAVIKVIILLVSGEDVGPL